MLPDGVGFVEEVFRVGTVVVDEIYEEFTVRVIDESMEQPLAEVVEVDLTAGLQAFDEETFHVVVEACAVFIVQQAEEVRSRGKNAAARRRWMNLEKPREMNQDPSDASCVRSELQKRWDVLRVDNIFVVIHKLDYTVAERSKDETLKDVALVEGILRCESFQALEARPSLKELLNERTNI